MQFELEGQKNHNRPNILFIMSDDHASHAISSYSKGRINQTPNIDRLAREGALFTNFFCTNSICEPSRAAILTGTYNHVNNVTTIDAHLDNSLPTMVKEFQSHGYQTAMIGKWHLGEGINHWPKGFDDWNILIDQGEYFNPRFQIGKGDDYNNPKVVTEIIEGYVTDIITDLTIRYIDNADPDRPFFIMSHHKAPHRSWEVDDKHKDMYSGETIPFPFTFDDDYSNRSQAAKEARMRITEHLWYMDIKCIPPSGVAPDSFVPYPDDLSEFYLIPEETGEKITFSSLEDLKEFKYQRFIKDYLRTVASIDDNIGRLYEYLENKGILGNTVVIYTSDQGFFLGDHGWFDKRFMYEESLRMPYIVRYPKGIKAGTIIDEIVVNVDIAPTLLSHAGIDIPSYIQGSNYQSLLGGEVPNDWQQSMYYRYWMHLAHHYVWAHYGVRTKHYKLVYYYGEALGQPSTIDQPKTPEWELFDLDKDPYELNNVYHDPEYKEIVKDLKLELRRLQEKLGDIPEKELE